MSFIGGENQNTSKNSSTCQTDKLYHIKKGMSDDYGVSTGKVKYLTLRIGHI